jgi:hypothetical protein
VYEKAVSRTRKKIPHCLMLQKICAGVNFGRPNGCSLISDNEWKKFYRDRMLNKQVSLDLRQCDAVGQE